MAIKDFNVNWEQKSLFMKILTIVGFIISIAIMILLFLMVRAIHNNKI